MTPAEASLYQLMKVQEKEREQLFISEENRLQNFYTIKSAFGDTKSIREPKDLYKFKFEEEETKQLSTTLASADELKQLARAMQGQQRTISPEELAKLIPMK